MGIANHRYAVVPSRGAAMSTRSVCSRIAVACSAMVLCLMLVPGTASATELRFHAHIDANTPGTNEGCGVAEWSTPQAVCFGDGANGDKGEAGAFKGKGITINWCASNNLQASQCRYFDKYRQSMPAGFTRYMQLSVYLGNSDLIGAVKMPNGPFVILGGTYEGKPILASNANEGAVATRGAPLGLYAVRVNLFETVSSSI